MALTIELTPGKQFAEGEQVDRSGLNLLGKPAVLLDGLIGQADIQDEAVHPDHVFVTAYFYAEESNPGADAIVITLDPPLRSLTAGTTIRLKTASVKTSAATLNVNGLGAKPVLKRGGLSLESGDLRSGVIAEMAYNPSLSAGNGAWELLSLTGNSAVRYATSAGTGTAYTLTCVPTVSALVNGTRVAFRAHAANTGAATLAVDGLTAKSIRKSGNTALAANDILANSAVELVYDSVLDVWLMLAPVTPIVPGRVYGQGVPTGTALAGTDTKVGTVTLTLPATKTWTYVRIGFQTLLKSDIGVGNSIRNMSVKIGADVVSLVGLAMPVAVPIDNSDDNVQVTVLLEGVVHASHVSDASLVLDVYAQTAGVADDTTQRVCYAVGEYQ